METPEAPQVICHPTQETTYTIWIKMVLEPIAQDDGAHGFPNSIQEEDAALFAFEANEETIIISSKPMLAGTSSEVDSLPDFDLVEINDQAVIFSSTVQGSDLTLIQPWSPEDSIRDHLDTTDVLSASNSSPIIEPSSVLQSSQRKYTWTNWEIIEIMWPSRPSNHKATSQLIELTLRTAYSMFLASIVPQLCGYSSFQSPDFFDLQREAFFSTEKSCGSERDVSERFTLPSVDMPPDQTNSSDDAPHNFPSSKKLTGSVTSNETEHGIRQDRLMTPLGPADRIGHLPYLLTKTLKKAVVLSNILSPDSDTSKEDFTSVSKRRLIPIRNPPAHGDQADVHDSAAANSLTSQFSSSPSSSKTHFGPRKRLSLNPSQDLEKFIQRKLVTAEKHQLAICAQVASQNKTPKGASTGVPNPPMINSDLLQHHLIQDGRPFCGSASSHSSERAETRTFSKRVSIVNSNSILNEIQRGKHRYSYVSSTQGLDKRSLRSDSIEETPNKLSSTIFSPLARLVNRLAELCGCFTPS